MTAAATSTTNMQRQKCWDVILTRRWVKTSSFSSDVKPVTSSCRGRRSTARLANTPRLSGPVPRPREVIGGRSTLGPRRPSEAASRLSAATRRRSIVVSELSVLADISSSSESKIFFCVDAAWVHRHSTWGNDEIKTRRNKVGQKPEKTVKSMRSKTNDAQDFKSLYLQHSKSSITRATLASVGISCRRVSVCLSQVGVLL